MIHTRTPVPCRAVPTPIESITVFCSSSDRLAPAYRAAAEELGDCLSQEGLTLVYGAGSVGLMGVLARSTQRKGGRIIGVITQRLIDAEQLHTRCDETIVVDTMRERKLLMESRGDAIIVLPGGWGTIEEFFEITVRRLVGEHTKPIVMVNTAGYFDPMLAMIDHMIEEGFAKAAMRSLFLVCEKPAEAIEALLRGDGRMQPDDSMMPSGVAREA